MSGSGTASIPSDRDDEPTVLLAEPFSIDELTDAVDALLSDTYRTA
jgi:hypothetical protein